MGAFYWEPEAYYGWQGYKLGAFDDSGKPTKTLRAFQEAAGTVQVAPSRPHEMAAWESRTTEIIWHGSRPTRYSIVDLSGKTVEQGVA